jgi:hypothetical protein
MKLVLTGAGLAAALALTISSVAEGRATVTDPVGKTPVAPKAATPVIPAFHTLPPSGPIIRPVARTVAPVWRPTLPTVSGSRGISSSALSGVVQKYCGSCHNAGPSKKGNLTLSNYDVDAATSHTAITEKMIRKLRAEMMPPPGSKRPAGDTLLALVETLENTLDKGPINPGNRVFQRLNRPEYAQVVKDLVNIDFNADDYLPLDTKSANFDNIADVQTLSPTLLDSYLTAASAVSLMAIGDRKAPATQAVYKVSGYVSQHPWDHVDGTPYGTRGGLAVTHNFPADAEYNFRVNVGGGVGFTNEDIVFTVDGDIVQTMHYEKGIARNNESAEFPLGFDYINTPALKIKAGQHQVAVAFIRRTEGPYEDLVKPHDWSRASGGTATPGTTEPSPITELDVNGPYNITGVSETPSRKEIFTCRPKGAVAQRACANQIISRLATKAYRRPLTAKDKASLMTFYDKNAVASNPNAFEDGVRASLQAMFASPYFVFRIEPKPANVAAGKDYQIGDLDLASRLSFFLWGTIPDERLMTLARHDQLHDKGTFNAEVKRMLADPRSEALGTRFAGQWLRLQDLDKVHPDAVLFPDYDQQLTDDFKTETTMFFNDIVKNDRSIFNIFNANYTFVNERLATHYGIPNVNGDNFRRVDYPEGSNRQGIMGQGSYLVQTSLGNRTSPVLRGKWVMEVLIGMPPPPPPPNIPDLEQTAGSKDGKPLTTRQRMEIHRANATCKACHQYMDPIGLSVDNFDVTGKFRYLENGAQLDTRGTMYDGMEIKTSADLVKSLLSRPIPLVRSFTENLMAYAIGRRVEDFDQPTVRAIAKEAKLKDYHFSAFVMGVVNSSAFRSKRAEAVADDAKNN